MSIVCLENKKKNILCKELKAAGYRSDPIKAWKATLARQEGEESQEEDEEEGADPEEDSDDGYDFMYLLSMHLLSLTKEKKDELLKQRDNKVTDGLASWLAGSLARWLAGWLAG